MRKVTFPKAFWIGLGSLFALFLALYGLPEYRVYCARKSGEAERVRAEQNRQIKVSEAEAALQAASAYAAADTIRAHGMARSNQIIGNSLQKNEAYLYYLWLQALEHNKGDVIYVATEANMPIMEAGRFNQLKSLSKNNETDEHSN